MDSYQNDPFIALPVIVWLKEEKKFTKSKEIRIRMSSVLHYEPFYQSADQRVASSGKEFTKVTHTRQMAQTHDGVDLHNGEVDMATRYYVVDMAPDKMDKLFNVERV